MSNHTFDLSDFHWLIEMIQTIDVGLVVIDDHYRIQIWNNFMEAHSGIKPENAHEQNLFELFPELPASWLKQKIDLVFSLKNRAFTTWEQHPHVFPFKNDRPITGRSKYMYQNITILPLSSVTGQTSHVSLIVYDATDTATHQLENQKLGSKLELMSHTDGLTMLNNRIYWESLFEQEFFRFKRTQHTASLVMIDIDHFKTINDTYGNPTGDQVIRAVARIIQQTCRQTDIAGRYSGETFSLILIDTPQHKASTFAERLRSEVQNQTIVAGQFVLNVTISIGIAQLDNEMENHAQWLNQADAALRQSKKNGRNQCTLYHNTMETE